MVSSPGTYNKPSMPSGYLFEGLERRKKQREASVLQQELPAVLMEGKLIVHFKTGTIFLYPRKVPMPHDTGFGIVFLQAYQQALEGKLLFRGTGIFRPVAGIQSALVADADAMGVVARGMRPYLVERSTTVNHPVAGDVVVIADVGKATGTMVTTAIVHGVTLRGVGGTTMDHDQVDAAVVLVLAAM